MSRFDVVVWGGPVYGPGASPHEAGDIGRVRWKRPTKIVTVSQGIGGIGSSAFAALGDSLDHGPGILGNLLSSHGIDLADVDQIALAGFSAFHGLASRILATEPEKVTAAVFLDACFSAVPESSWPKEGYVAFGAMAARGMALMVYTASAGGGPGGQYPSSTGSQCMRANVEAAAARAGVPLEAFAPPAPMPPGDGMRAGQLFGFDYGPQYADGFTHNDMINRWGVATLEAFLPGYLAGERIAGGSSRSLLSGPMPLLIGAALGVGIAAALALRGIGSRRSNPDPLVAATPASLFDFASLHSRDDGESVLVKGDTVTFFRQDGASTRLPPSYKLVHDTRGDYIDARDVIVMRVQDAARYTHGMRLSRSVDARNYFGKSAKLVPKSLDLPRGPWSRCGLVNAIWYRRAYLGELVPFEHPYDPPVPLFQCGDAYKLRLPDGAVYDERGFVWP